MARMSFYCWYNDDDCGNNHEKMGRRIVTIIITKMITVMVMMMMIMIMMMMMMIAIMMMMMIMMMMGRGRKRSE